MIRKNVYERLAQHLSLLGMGYPPTENLVAILKENFRPAEAEVALAIPTGVIPLQPVSVDKISGRVDLPEKELMNILDKLSQRGLLFCGKTQGGDEGYALQQVGFSFPQTFFGRERIPPMHGIWPVI